MDELLAHLTRQAESEAAAVVAGARERARLIDEHADAEAARRRAEHAVLHEQASRKLARTAVAAAERRFREQLLAEREHALDRVFDAALRSLASMPVARYQTGLEQMVTTALRYLEGFEVVLRCPPDAAGIVRALADQRSVTLAAADDAPAGLLAEAANGAVRVDCTLPAMLARRRAELAVALAERIEGRP